MNTKLLKETFFLEIVFSYLSKSYSEDINYLLKSIHVHMTKYGIWQLRSGLWCLTHLSTIFH